MIRGVAPVSCAAGKTFLRADAALWFAGEQIDGALAIAARRSADVAIAFQTDDYRVAGRFQQLAAHAFVEDRADGLIVASGVELVHAPFNPGTLWRAQAAPSFLEPEALRWFIPTVRALNCGDGKPLVPLQGRPAGVGVAVIDLVEDISPQTAASTLNAIDEAADKSILFRVDCRGGDVASGLRIYKALASHPHWVEAEIDGSADSMAAVVIMAADFRRIAHDATVMLHEPYVDSAKGGNAAALRAAAESLDKSAAELAQIVTFGTGIRASQTAKMLKDETRLTAARALDMNVVHEITYNTVPRVVSRRFARFQAVAGPYSGVRSTARRAAPPLCDGERYKAGDVVTFGGRTWRATRTARGSANPLLHPGASTAWELV